jgi:hypothetical protein
MAEFLDWITPTVLEVLAGLLVIAFAMGLLCAALDYPPARRK